MLGGLKSNKTLALTRKEQQRKRQRKEVRSNRRRKTDEEIEGAKTDHIKEKCVNTASILWTMSKNISHPSMHPS